MFFPEFIVLLPERKDIMEMKIFDTTSVCFIKTDESVSLQLPIEYASLEGLSAEFEAGVEDDKLVFRIKPDIDGIVRCTVEGFWGSLRKLFSLIGDIGEKPPWDDIDIVWQAPRAYESKVPIAAEEVLQHLYMRKMQDTEAETLDVRKSIHDTFTKLCEMASRKLGFNTRLFTIGFGDAAGNKFAMIPCVYGVYDVICEIFSEEFMKVCDEKYWHMESEIARQAVLAAYRKIKHLEDNPDEFEKERARIQKKWGFPLRESAETG